MPASLQGPPLARAAGSEQAIDLPAGLPGATIVAAGQGAPPKLTLIGPKGERITSPDDLRPVQQAPFLILKDPHAKLTQFAIAKPSPGRWRVLVEDGSAPVVSIASANGLAKPQIDAKVVGRGHRRMLEYRVKPVSGQKVRFLERGPSAGKRIGDASGARGRLPFRPAPGKGERRRIVALVTQDGGRAASTRLPATPLRPSSARAVRARCASRGGARRSGWRGGRRRVPTSTRSACGSPTDGG